MAGLRRDECLQPPCCCQLGVRDSFLDSVEKNPIIAALAMGKGIPVHLSPMCMDMGTWEGVRGTACRATDH